MSESEPGLINNKLGVHDGVPILGNQEDFEEICCKVDQGTYAYQCMTCVGDCDCTAFDAYVCNLRPTEELPEMMYCGDYLLLEGGGGIYVWSGTNIWGQAMTVTLQHTSHYCDGSDGVSEATLTVEIAGLTVVDDATTTGGNSTYKCGYYFRLVTEDSRLAKAYVYPTTKKPLWAAVTFNEVDIDFGDTGLMMSETTYPCGPVYFRCYGVSPDINSTWVVGDDSGCPGTEYFSATADVREVDPEAGDFECNDVPWIRHDIDASLRVSVSLRYNGDVKVTASYYVQAHGFTRLGSQCDNCALSSTYKWISIFSGETESVQCQDTFDVEVTNDITSYTSCYPYDTTCRRGKNGSASVHFYHVDMSNM